MQYDSNGSEMVGLYLEMGLSLQTSANVCDLLSREKEGGVGGGKRALSKACIQKIKEIMQN